MNDHTWARENMAAFLCGGLSEADAARLQAHAADCLECEAALEETQGLDAALVGLFEPARPAPGMEDRVVRTLRTAKSSGVLFTGWVNRATKIAAAVLVVTTFGVLAATQMVDGKLPLPGEWGEPKVAKAYRQAQSREAGAAKNLTNEDPGIDAELDASVDVERIDEQVVELKVTDNPIGAPTKNDINKATYAAPGAVYEFWYDTSDSRRLSERPEDRKISGIGGLGGGGFQSGGGGLGGGLGGLGYDTSGPTKIGSGTFTLNGSSTSTGGTIATRGLIDGTVTSTSGAIPQSGYFIPGLLRQDAVTVTGPSSSTSPTASATDSIVIAGTTVTGDRVVIRQPIGGDTNGSITQIDSRNPQDVLFSFELQRKELAQKFGDEHPEMKSLDGRIRMLKGFLAKQAAGEVVRPEEVQAVIADKPMPARRVVLRSGDIEFEVASFDSAHAAVTKLVMAIDGAFVGTVNSDKLPNGKVKGSITVRVPPDKLDGLVLDLRRELGKDGELKGVKLNSQDVSKQYTDLESRLRAARAMETRLLDVIKNGKGEIKDLLQAEKELGVWRTRIEEIEGELRYYANLASMSTLTIVLAEKEIRAAAGITESERVQAGVEVEDVDKTYQQLLAAITEAKGRVTKAELKQLAAGQFNATLNFEAAPDQAGPLRDRLRQVGRVARLEIDRTQKAVDGTLPSDAKVTRGDTLFFVQLYNLANIQPRETVTQQVASADVPAAYQALRDAVAKANGRVQVAQLNEQDRQNVTAQFHFDVRRTEDAAVQVALAAAGEAVARQVVRAPESDQVTDTKVLYQLNLFGVNRIKPRETVTLAVAASNVPASYASLRDAVTKADGQVIVAKLNERDSRNVSAEFHFAVKRADEPAIRSALEAAGEAVSRDVVRAPESDVVTDAKVLYQVSLTGANNLKPRETTALALEVPDVDSASALLAAQAGESKARLADTRTDRDRSGKSIVRLTYYVPLVAAAGFVEKAKSFGAVKALQSSRDPNAPDGKLAIARVDVTLTGADRIVGQDAGFWPPIQTGLKYSANVLLTSMTWVVFALCVVLPWAVLTFVGYRLLRRLWRRNATATT